MNNEDKIKIVIVEDDDEIRFAFQNLINDEQGLICDKGYSNCEEAIKNFEIDSPDLILMDIELPGISGIEGIKKIKSISSSANIIAVTVHENDEIVFDALCAGASGYLTKNISTQKLIDSIREAVSGGAPMSTNIARLVVNSFHKNIKSPLKPARNQSTSAFIKREKLYNDCR